MNFFTDTLKEIDGRLDLPQPARSRVLLEIAADLRDLYDHYRDQGLSSKESRQRAVEQCDLSDEALSELMLVHTSAWRRFLDRFSEQAQTRWERALLVVLIVFIAAASGRLVFGVDVFATAGAWVWPALAITFVSFAFAGHKFYVAFVKKDHRSHRLQAGLPALLVAGAANLVIGAFGSSTAMYTAARRAADDYEGFWLYLTQWVLGSSSLLIVCFAAAILTALLWYVLANKIARIELAEAALLLGD